MRIIAKSRESWKKLQLKPQDHHVELKWKVSPAGEDRTKAPGRMDRAGELRPVPLVTSSQYEGQAKNFSSTFSNRTIVLLQKHHRENCQDVTKYVAVRNYPFIIQVHCCILTFWKFFLSWSPCKFLCPGRISAYYCFWCPANWPLGILMDRFPSRKIPKVLFLVHLTYEFPEYSCSAVALTLCTMAHICFL